MAIPTTVSPSRRKAAAEIPKKTAATISRPPDRRRGSGGILLVDMRYDRIRAFSGSNSGVAPATATVTG
jgi:hypothetical protein